MEEENSESTDEEDLKANPEFVQILAPYSEVCTQIMHKPGFYCMLFVVLLVAKEI